MKQRSGAVDPDGPPAGSRSDLEVMGRRNREPRISLLKTLKVGISGKNRMNIENRMLAVQPGRPIPKGFHGFRTNFKAGKRKGRASSLGIIHTGWAVYGSKSAGRAFVDMAFQIQPRFSGIREDVFKVQYFLDRKSLVIALPVLGLLAMTANNATYLTPGNQRHPVGPE